MILKTSTLPVTKVRAVGTWITEDASDVGSRAQVVQRHLAGSCALRPRPPPGPRAQLLRHADKAASAPHSMATSTPLPFVFHHGVRNVASPARGRPRSSARRRRRAGRSRARVARAKPPSGHSPRDRRSPREPSCLDRRYRGGRHGWLRKAARTWRLLQRTRHGNRTKSAGITICPHNAVDGRRRMEPYVRAQAIPACLAPFASAARYAGLDRPGAQL